MGDLVPCKFYARGSCRFGDNCRFYHGPVTPVFSPQQSVGVTSPTSYAGHYNKGSTYPPGSAYPGAQDEALMAHMRTIAVDMQEWSRFRWPYSSYGPIGCRPSVPGTQDLSEDEVRCAYILNGKRFPPELQLEARLEQINGMQRVLSNPTAETFQLVKSLTETPLPQAASIFPVATQAQTTIHGSSIFGGALSAAPAPAFGGLSQSHQQSSSSLGNFNFAVPASSQDSSGTMEVFENASKSAPLSSFHFASPQSNSNFSHPTQSVPSVFGSSNVPQPQPTTFFGQGSTTQANQMTSGVSCFQNTMNQNQSQGIQDQFIYSQESDLSKEEVEAFKSNEFGDFPPINPPPKSLCFP